ncbi:hypothetical protein KKF84_07915, partial [Myxococcota bacterium]|nr:hypothetical protein [Myxococcota bacterium]
MEITTYSSIWFRDKSIPVIRARDLANSHTFSLATPVIDTKALKAREQYPKAWEILMNQVQLFKIGSEIFCRDGSELHPLSDKPFLERLLVDGIDFKSGDKDITMPQKFADLMLAKPPKEIPEVDFVAQFPVVTQSGHILSKGCKEGVLCLYGGPPLVVPEKPTEEEAKAALLLIADEFMGELPFDPPYHRNRAIAALLQSFVRPVINGATPLYMFTAPKGGTGKSLLAKCIAQILSGDDGHEVDFEKSKREREEEVVTALNESAVAIIIDNVDKPIKWAFLDKLLTSQVHRPRQKYTHRTKTLQNQALWMLTANAPKVFEDTARRTIEIHMDAKMENPRDRQGFKHNLETWVPEHRKELLEACITVVAYWVSLGGPIYDVP